MLNRLIELQRQVCKARADAGLSWYTRAKASAIPAGTLFIEECHLDILTRAMSHSWETALVYMATDDVTLSLVMDTDSPDIVEDVDSDAEVIALHSFEVYVYPQVGEKAPAPVPAPVKRPPRHLEFI